MSHAVKDSLIATGVCVMLFAPTGGVAARPQSNTAAPMVDVDTVGPKVGDALPEFTLRDQAGHIHSLKSLLGPRGAVIVFFRSADW
jgi:hypothetical protein